MRVDLSYMLVILLLPILPAFLLFRFLPSTASVEGPMKGLSLKFGGAFGGYIAAVLIAWQIAGSLLAPTWSDNWNVVAHIQFDPSAAGSPPIGEVAVVVRPPSAAIDPGGTVQMPVSIPRVAQSALGIQRLIVSYDGYAPVTVPLVPASDSEAAYGGEDYKVTFDKSSMQIVIGRPIVLTKAAR